MANHLLLDDATASDGTHHLPGGDYAFIVTEHNGDIAVTFDPGTGTFQPLRDPYSGGQVVFKQTGVTYLRLPDCKIKLTAASASTVYYSQFQHHMPKQHSLNLPHGV
ncbi:MAG: hypothetical protein KDA87_24675 [Planctomycetales bacterium]|nr:hypothetical protein [Planctomycetales bacterium]